MNWRWMARFWILDQKSHSHDFRKRHVILACEQVLLFWRVKGVSRERARERRSPSLARSRGARFACPNRRACSQATSSMFTELCGSSHLSLTFGSQLNKSQQFVREAISYDFLTVADDRRVRNSGIHVVVDYVSLNDFYWGSLTGFSCTVMPFSPSQFSKHQPKRGKSILGSFVSSSNGYLLLF